MKKFLYLFFVCVFVTTTVFPLKYFAKHTVKRKPKVHAAAEEVSMTLPASLSFDTIQGGQREQIVHSIQHFPTTDYHLFSVPRCGYFYLDNLDDMIKGHLRKGMVWEPYMKKVFQQFTRPGSTVLDIGAHIGTHTKEMSQIVGENGKVLAFEPQPKTFQELFMNMSMNNVKNVTFYWAGVGAHKGKIELSPLVASNEGGTGLGGGTGQFVELLTIDSLALNDVSLMKIDVEGMEEEVLEGARETILSNRPVIIIEIQGGSNFANASKESRSKIMHTIDMLEGLGYNVSQLCVHDWLAVPKKQSMDQTL